MTIARRNALALVLLVVAVTMATLYVRTPKLERAGAIDKLLPSVVRITTRTLTRRDAPDARPGDAKVQEAFGSGFIIDRTGYIVTNRHVVKDAYEIVVQLQDGAPMRARLIGDGGDVDLALLKVDTNKKLQPVVFGDSNELSLGQEVVVIGNPFGLGTTVTSGIVSALNRDLGFSLFDSFIQTDAPINHGNSGGPVFNMKGQVIGVSTAYYTGGDAKGGSIGLGFAIPSETTQEVAALLRRYGYPKVGWIGVEGATLTPEMINALDAPTKSGAIVADLVKGGPAEGVLQPGDLILEVNGYPLDDMRMLRREAAAALGEKLKMKIFRDGRQERVVVAPVEWPGAHKPDKTPTMRAPGDTSVANGLGFTCDPVKGKSGRQFEASPSADGVMVTAVQAGSPAADSGLMIGDVVTSMQLRAVRTPDDISARIAEAAQAKRDYVAMLVNSQGRPKFLTLPLKWQAPPAQAAADGAR